MSVVLKNRENDSTASQPIDYFIFLMQVAAYNGTKKREENCRFTKGWNLALVETDSQLSYCRI
jgi:hypothetical protein